MSNYFAELLKNKKNRQETKKKGKQKKLFKNLSAKEKDVLLETVCKVLGLID